MTSSAAGTQPADRPSLADFIAAQMSQDYPDADAAGSSKGGTSAQSEDWRQK